MADVIPFPTRPADLDVDLLTAVDAAIRDLRDILRHWGDEAARVQADECRRMLEEAYRRSLKAGEPTGLCFGSASDRQDTQ
jgi:hypothetical protein